MTTTRETFTDAPSSVTRVATAHFLAVDPIERGRRSRPLVGGREDIIDATLDHVRSPQSSTRGETVHLPEPLADTGITENAISPGEGFSASGRWIVRAGLADHSDSSTLLRLVTILHTRCSGVENLVFDASQSTVRATVRLALGNSTGLQQMLLRAVDVTGVIMCPEDEGPPLSEQVVRMSEQVGSDSIQSRNIRSKEPCDDE